MRIPSNKIGAITGFYKKELEELYPPEEINTFIKLAFAHYLGVSSSELVLRADETVSESELLKLYFVVKGLKKHKPVQYILGETEFYGLKFKVNKNVLIPRPETEELVDWIIKEFQNMKYEIRNSVLDIGTGSGCIAVSLKKYLSGAEVFALDVSEEALQVAKENALLNKVNVNFIHGDIFSSSVSQSLSSYDVIVSNPPYITNAESELMQPNVLDYEPHLALFVDDNNPLLFYSRIAALAGKHLGANGRLYFEINEKYGNDVAKLLINCNFTDIIVKKDLSGKDRIISCKLKR